MKRYLYSILQKTKEFVGKKDSGTKIFMFHQVCDDTSKWIDANVSVTFDSFKMFIDFFIEKKYEFIDGNTYDGVNDCNRIWITFDDIFEDAYSNAIQYLIFKRIPFTVFVTESFLDKKLYITSSELEKLNLEKLCCIGFHSKNHKLMRFLNRYEKLDEMNSHSFIVGRNIETNLFAFPYGSFYAVDNFSVTESLKKYKYVFSTINKECSSHDVLMRYLPRINVCESNINKILKKYGG